MPNYQLADLGMFDPNSEWAKQAAAQVLQQQTAQQVAQEAAQQTAQQPEQAPPQQQPVQVQPATPPPVQQAQPIVQQQAPKMPDNNGLAATAANVLTPLGDAGRALASQVAKFKMNYAAAERAGDAEGMKQAHEGAEALRRAAGQYGIDVSRLGANDTMAQMQAMLQADRAKGVSDIANMLTPQEYYNKSVEQKVAQGVSRRKAEELSLADTERYEGEYRRTLGNAFARYGVNDNGEMNRFGAQIANLMYGNDPQSVALYDRYYANPRDLWKFNKNMEVQDKLYGQKVDFGQHQFDWNRALNNDKFNFQLRLQANQFNFQKTMAEMQQEFAKASREEQIELAKNNPQLFMLLHGGGGKSGGNAPKEKAPSEKQVANMENANDTFNAAWNGDLDGDNISNAINELEKTKQQTADGEARGRLTAMQYALNAKREGTAWKDHGSSGSPDNFINYYEAVKNSGNEDLVKELEWVYKAALYKKEHPDEDIPKDPSYYTSD